MFKRGKKPARPGAVQLRFGAYFRAANLPTVPAVFGRPWLIAPGMYGNDQVGDCVIASGANGTRLLRAEAGLAPIRFLTPDMIADYSAAGAPDGYLPGKPDTDQVLDLQVGAAYRQKTGLIDSDGHRHTIGPYTALRVGDIDEMLRACYLLGAVDIGVQLPSVAEDQFNAGEVWDRVPDNDGGGHCIALVGRNSKGNLLFFSWGRLQAATAAWVHACMDEGVAAISLERLDARGLSPQGFNQAALLDDFKQVTS